MTDVFVPDRMVVHDETAAQTRATGSSVRLAQPLKDGCNHLLGWRKRRLIHLLKKSSSSISYSEDGGFYTYRHPNCDFLHFWLKLGETGNSEAYVEITAGTGDPVRVGPRYGGLPNGLDEYECVVPWDISDTGYQEVTITSDEVSVDSIMAHELYSPVLDVPTQLGILPYDPTYVQGGLREGYYIIESDPAGPRGLIKRTKDCWDYALRQALSWWTTDDWADVDTTSWEIPFPGLTTFGHKARRKKAETTRAYRVYAYTYQAGGGGGGGYYWRISSGTNTLTTGLLTNASGAWTLLTGLLVDTVSDDTLTFEMRRATATPINRPAVVQRISIVEEYV